MAKTYLVEFWEKGGFFNFGLLLSFTQFVGSKVPKRADQRDARCSCLLGEK